MRRSLGNVLLTLLAAAALGGVLYRFRDSISLHGFGWRRLIQSLRQARLFPLLFSLNLVFICYAIRAQRWIRLSKHIGKPVFGHVYSATLIGFTAIFVLGRAGEPVRPLLIARKGGLPASETLGIYVLERVFDAATAFVLACLSLMVDPGMFLHGREALPAAARTSGVVTLVGLLGVITGLVYFRAHGAGLLEQRLASWCLTGGWRARLAHLFKGFSKGLQSIRTSADLLAAIGYSTVHWLLVAWICFWVAQSFGGRLSELSFAACVLVMAFTAVGSTLQLPGIGAGAQVASFLAFAVLFGVEKEPAAAASIVLWLITFAASTLVGVPLLVHEGWSLSRLRRLVRTESVEASAPALT